MDFTKITYNRKELTVTLKWEQLGKTGMDEHQLVSRDDPHPDFTDALDALGPVVAEVCKLDADPDYKEDDLVVRGVTLKDAPDPDSPGELVDGITITALRALDWANAPLVINTPFSPISAVPNDELEDLVKQLCKEAQAYIKGKRKQGDLFAGDGADKSVDLRTFQN